MSKYEFDWVVTNPATPEELAKFPVLWDMSELADEMDKQAYLVRAKFDRVREIAFHSAPAFPNSGAVLYARPFPTGRGTTVDNVRLVRDPDPVPQVWTIGAVCPGGKEFVCYDQMAVLNVFGEKNVDKSKANRVIVRFHTIEQAREYVKDYSNWLRMKNNFGEKQSTVRFADCEICNRIHESTQTRCNGDFLTLERNPYSIRDKLICIEREVNGKWTKTKRSPTTTWSSEHPAEISTLVM